LLELFTPPVAIKENANKAIHTSLVRTGTREANVSTKIYNKHSWHKRRPNFGKDISRLHE
jgi:hypothetical protein